MTLSPVTSRVRYQTIRRTQWLPQNFTLFGGSGDQAATRKRGQVLEIVSRGIMTALAVSPGDTDYPSSRRRISRPFGRSLGGPTLGSDAPPLTRQGDGAWRAEV